ncbi:MotA/TolQ/ExbB proton channel family protein [Rubritalea marina]|uniref:MotA/TolQ/ExbB proton channel family protein n=1 Tax=Rubritalea marina TaxID=361055 RepID=UPI0003684017|nr:MotA/TolQ/ExbB proton channel family protein [Rubritalea marina]
MIRGLIRTIAVASTLGVAPALELSDLRDDLKQSQEKLGGFRAAEREKNIALAEELAQLEVALGEAREELKLIELGRKGRDDLKFSVKREAQAFERDFDSIESTLKDFSVQFWLRSRQELPESGADSASPSQVALLGAALDVIESKVGGELSDSKVVNGEGDLVQGKTYSFGPLAWFQSADKQESGVVQYLSGKQYGNLDTAVDRAALEALFAGREAQMMLDLTGGKARMIAKIQDDPLRLFEKGGVWIWPIIAIAVISLICGVFKFLELRRMKEPDAAWIGSLLQAVKGQELERAAEICAGTQHPVGEVIAKSLSFVEHGAEVVDEVIFEQMIGVQNAMQRWLPFIAVTAAAAPLLGLLGTVSGMIRMFNVITVTGTGDVKPMAGGISEALTTTLFGLVVAIPALVLHTMLSRRSSGIVQTSERLSLTFTNGLKK